MIRRLIAWFRKPDPEIDFDRDVPPPQHLTFVWGDLNKPPQVLGDWND